MIRSRRNVAACLVSLVWLGLAPALGFFPSPAFVNPARAAILIDARAGSVFFERNADAFIEPASTSKLMTMVMVFEALKAGKLKMDQDFLITEDAWRRG